VRTAMWPSPSWWRQRVLLKRRSTSIRLYGAMFQKTCLLQILSCCYTSGSRNRLCGFSPRTAQWGGRLICDHSQHLLLPYCHWNQEVQNYVCGWRVSGPCHRYINIWKMQEPGIGSGTSIFIRLLY
jgi:hypothetical protein